ncbi:MAG: alpha/beta fold hydrolase [Alphaproteobacteria bacterium]|nr:alpha/beta fold hydrolase [Alphaproteobacteria bacterium]
MAATIAALTELKERPDTVALLTQIWRRVLQTDDVTPDSNFFDLGGDSLLALTLFLEIERATGRQLPITAIYDAQTVAEQCALLRDETTVSEFSPLVLLKAGGEGPPLFMFHGIGGTVVEFAALGKLIETGGDVYAVQAQGLDGTLPPLDSVHDMAALYWRAIRERQPSGPYWLCGYSFGGLIAVEVARLARKAGEEIGQLFLIDAYAHPVTWPRKSLLKVRLRKQLRSLASIFRRSPRESLARLKARRNARSSEGAHLSEQERRKAVEKRKQQWLTDTRPNLPLPLMQTRMAGDKAVYRYRHSHYPGSAIFLKARHPDPDFPDDPKHVWSRWIQNLRVYRCPGSHLTIVSDHAAGVADRINACIREAKGLSAPGRASRLRRGAPLRGFARA